MNKKRQGNKLKLVTTMLVSVLMIVPVSSMASEEIFEENSDEVYEKNVKLGEVYLEADSEGNSVDVIIYDELKKVQVPRGPAKINFYVTYYMDAEASELYTYVGLFVSDFEVCVDLPFKGQEVKKEDGIKSGKIWFNATYSRGCAGGITYQVHGVILDQYDIEVDGNHLEGVTVVIKSRGTNDQSLFAILQDRFDMLKQFFSKLSILEEFFYRSCNMIDTFSYMGL